MPRFSGRRSAAVIAIGALVIASVAMGSVAPASAVTGDLSFDADAGSLGAIPDSLTGICEDAGVTKVVTFNVTGLSGPATDVRVLGLTLTHAFRGDLVAELKSPGNAASIPLFSRVGSLTSSGCGSAGSFSGAYTFADDAAGNFWTSTTPTPSGAYRASSPGRVDTGGQPTSITAAFSALSDLNGSWSVAITDYGKGDVGTVTAASLQIVDSKGVTLTVAPTITTSTRPVFAFGFDRVADLQCSITPAGGSQAFGACSGPGTSDTPASDLADGDYTFAVRPLYSVSPTPGGATTRTFTVRSTSCAAATTAVSTSKTQFTNSGIAVTIATSALAAAKSKLSAAAKAVTKATKAVKKAKGSKLKKAKKVLKAAQSKKAAATKSVAKAVTTETNAKLASGTAAGAYATSLQSYADLCSNH